MQRARRQIALSVMLAALHGPGAGSLCAHPLDRDGDGYPDAQYAALWTPQDEAKARSLADKIARARFGLSVSPLLKELRALGPAARFAVPEVVMLLERFDGRPKEEALGLLKDPNFQAQAVFAAMVHNTEHPNKWVRELASGVINEAAPVDVPVYARCLTDPDPAVRKQALWALSIVGPDARAAAPALAERIWQDQAFMALGVLTLARMEADAQLEDLRARARRARTEDPAYKYAGELDMAATVNLGMLYERQLTAAGASAYSRTEAMRKLRGLSWISAETASALVAALTADQREVRDEAAATLLAQFQANPEGVTRALLKALDPSQERPGPAAFLLAKLGEQALPQLLPMLDDVQADSRIQGIVALALLGEAAAAAAPRLAQMAERDVDPQVKQAAQKALVAIGRGQADAIELGPPSTTVSSYVVVEEAQARWLRVKMSGAWSAGFVFGTLPPAAPAPALRIALYDAQKKKLQTILIADHFQEKKPGEYFLKLYAETKPAQEVSVPFKVEFVEE